MHTTFTSVDLLEGATTCIGALMGDVEETLEERPQ